MAAQFVEKIEYYLVLDFEATCDEKRTSRPQEIIEFPVLKVNATTLETESTFHTYVTPTVHPQLTAFCTRLTGITQKMVTDQPSLLKVLEMFDEWMVKEKLKDNPNICFVTCGDWDLKTMLPGQCAYLRVNVPQYFKKWMNIKKVFSRIMKCRSFGMAGMLDKLNLTLDGRHHSGIDDARNTAKILRKLLKKEPNIQPTTVLRY
ncbi:ERI1 exoribonuclease 3-like [Dysidea avara]|uniref:ERI1 exoribonuclease 3-like n=1 Tax=Dysidea avara TaxID=196820 RepID=UPI00332E1164